MTAFEKHKTKLTLKKYARMIKDGADCSRCPAIKVCRAASDEGLDCERAFIKWGNMEVSE